MQCCLMSQTPIVECCVAVVEAEEEDGRAVDNTFFKYLCGKLRAC